MVNGGRFALFDFRHRGRGQPRLERHDGFGLARRRRRLVAEQAEHARDVRQVGRARRPEGRLALEIVIAVRQA